MPFRDLSSSLCYLAAAIAALVGVSNRVLADRALALALLFLALGLLLIGK